MDISKGKEKERWDELLGEQLWVIDWMWLLWRMQGAHRLLCFIQVNEVDKEAVLKKMAGSLGTEVSEQFFFLSDLWTSFWITESGLVYSLSMCLVSELCHSSGRANQLSFLFSIFLFHRHEIGHTRTKS